MNKESWRDINGYEGLYQVSSLGRVKSLPRLIVSGKNSGQRTTKEHILTTSPNHKGYIPVKLYLNKKGCRRPVHRLAAEAFIPNSENKPEVHHINHIRDNNRVENLMWVTANENRDSIWYEKFKTGQAISRKSKMKHIWIDGIEYESRKRVAEVLNIPAPYITNSIKNGKSSLTYSGVRYMLSKEDTHERSIL